MMRFSKIVLKLKVKFILLFCNKSKSKKPFIQFMLKQSNFC